MISVGVFENELLYSTFSAVNKSLIFPCYNRNSTPFSETLATPERPIQRTIERFCNPY